MNPKLIYIDSSALVKLIARERESAALLGFLPAWPKRISSVLARVELFRAIRRSCGRTSELRRAERVLSGLTLIRIDDDILRVAARLDPPDIRSLDAIHLATALSLQAELAGMITYDARMTDGAGMCGLTVFAPR